MTTSSSGEEEDDDQQQEQYKVMVLKGSDFNWTSAYNALRSVMTLNHDTGILDTLFDPYDLNMKVMIHAAGGVLSYLKRGHVHENQLEDSKFYILQKHYLGTNNT